MTTINAPLVASDVIDGLYSVPFRAFTDARGRFTETFRREWFPWVDWDKMQSNRSESKANVLRGLHYHHRQIDYWYVLSGVARVGLVDLRPSSPTHRAAQIIELGGDNDAGLFIPVGVAHGFYAVTDVMLVYIVNNYYDGTDEHGVLWNDPALGLDWGADAPILSPRDMQNPPLTEIPAANMPK